MIEQARGWHENFHSAKFPPFSGPLDPSGGLQLIVVKVWLFLVAESSPVQESPLECGGSPGGALPHRMGVVI
uniref:Uncharacterized protein n=1 Tax=Angiostrongylus cantonensis TaxID=6313 RepID=A0A0K0DNI6_ANGCA